MSKINVVFVCLGNICRSPLGEGIFRHKVDQAGLADQFHIDSAGTSSYHVGEPPDPGSVRVARRHRIDISRQRSRQFVRGDFSAFDYLIAMDASNRRNMLALSDGPDSVRGRLWLMRNFEFDHEGAGDDDGVPDPWGGGPNGFDDVYNIVDRSCENLLKFVRHNRQI